MCSQVQFGRDRNITTCAISRLEGERSFNFISRDRTTIVPNAVKSRGKNPDEFSRKAAWQLQGPILFFHITKKMNPGKRQEGSNGTTRQSIAETRSTIPCEQGEGDGCVVRSLLLRCTWPLDQNMHRIAYERGEDGWMRCAVIPVALSFASR